MRRLSPQDASFLHLEDLVSHMHIGSVAILEGPPPSYDELAERVRANLPQAPRYRQRVHFVPLALGQPVSRERAPRPDGYRAVLARHGQDAIAGAQVPEWSPELHEEFMDRWGIRTSVVSISDPGVYFGDADEAKETARLVNDAGAELIAADPQGIVPPRCDAAVSPRRGVARA